VNHRVESESGHVVEFVVEQGRIVEMLGDWPAGEDELVFSTGVPPHMSLSDVPEHVRVRAAERGMDVCYYDPDHCRTCYCDDAGHMHCVGMC
jgi:hypothetical protein